MGLNPGRKGKGDSYRLAITQDEALSVLIRVVKERVIPALCRSRRPVTRRVLIRVVKERVIPYQSAWR